MHGPITDHARASAQTSLDELDVGGRARITKLKPAAGLTVRLLEMGLVPGTEVSLVKRAPFGDPIEFCVRGYHLSLRRDEARLVLAEFLSA